VLAQEIGADAARHVAAARAMLDLDHLGAHVREMARPVRPRAVLLDGENAQAFEGQLHRVPFALPDHLAMLGCFLRGRPGRFNGSAG
jgi:hypothetical protein